MRSVVIHLVNTTRDAVREHLTRFAEAEPGERWRYPVKVAIPVLYIEFSKDNKREFEADELTKLKLILGKMPEVTVIAKVSGRVPGNDEVETFAKSVLSAFGGVAEDEYSRHWWTLPDIASGAKHDGLGFFDHEGWAQKQSVS